MQAIRIHEHGDIDVLKLEEIPDPSPAPGEVLVEVRTCALNYLALWQRRGIHGVRLPHIVSSEIAGVVRRAQFGKGVLDVGESR